MIDNNTPMIAVAALINGLPEGIDIEVRHSKLISDVVLWIGMTEVRMGEGNLVDDINEALRIIKETEVGE